MATYKRGNGNDDGDENKLFVDVRFSTSLDRDKENSVMLNFETGPG